jgi:plastocyanin
MLRAPGFAIALAFALLFAAAPALADVTVVIGHGSFDPAQVKLEKGESVIFHNVQEMPGGHTVVADDGSWKSPALALDGKFSKRFEQSGIVKIHLEQHPDVAGEIVVE